MKTKLLAPAMIAVVCGLSSLSTGALAQYSDTKTTVKTMPASTSDVAANDVAATALVAKHNEHASTDYATNTDRPATSERATRIKVGPAMIFQLREAAGG